MPRKTGLGRGLDALIPGSDRPVPSGVQQVPVDRISPNPHQPRTHFAQDELEELAASIREHGIIQPLILTSADTPGEYQLIAGERRLLAARQAGLESVPAILREASDQQRLELALIENVQRADLSPLEAAEAYRHLAEDFGLSHEEIARRVGKSRTAITNTIRLLKLPAEVRQAVVEGQISEGHARALLGLPDPRLQALVLQGILEHGLTVRQTEELTRLPAPVGAALAEGRIDLGHAQALLAVQEEDIQLGLLQAIYRERIPASQVAELVRLPLAVLHALAAGQIKVGHAQALLALPDTDVQVDVLGTILREKMTAQQAEDYIRRLLTGAPPQRQKALPTPELLEVEERLRHALGTRVNLSRRGKGGTITIRFYSDEELNALLDQLVGPSS